nr:MAG TPA: Ribosome-60S, ribosome biogenesis, LSU processome.7A [Caudoviricetes sp.]
MDVKDKILVDIQVNKKYKDLDIVGFSGGDASILRNIFSKYDDDFKMMAREEN